MATKLHIEKKVIDNLVSDLERLFCDLKSDNKRYNSVWLSEVDSEIYDIEKFILTVKAEHEIESCNEEIIFLTQEIFKKLPKGSRSLIWRIVVINADDEIHCESDDLVVIDNDDYPCT
jgi:hypothetical protein